MNEYRSKGIGVPSLVLSCPCILASWLRPEFRNHISSKQGFQAELRRGQEETQQAKEIWCAQTRDGIPPCGCIESICAATRVVALGDVIQRILPRVKLLSKVSRRTQRPGRKLTTGLMNPTGGWFAKSLTSFTIVRIAPMTGADADVPYTSLNFPLTYQM